MRGSAAHSATADDALRAAIAAYSVAFPGRVRACYTLGSYADASAIAASDLDLTIVFAGALSDDERERATQLARRLAAASAIELDIEIDDTQTLARGASPNFKLGAALVAGEEMRGEVPLIALAKWTRDRMHSSWWRVARLFARPDIVTLPLDYPEPADAFRGYTRRSVRLASGEAVASSRDLIRLVGWAATGLLALRAGVYVAHKREVGPLFRAHIGGEWAPLVEQTYTLCRTRWGYFIPDDATERARLCALCDQTLGFERFFVAQYREYLLAELASHDAEAARFAAEALNRAPLRDAAVIAALAALAQRDGAPAAPLARSALALLQAAY